MCRSSGQWRESWWGSAACTVRMVNLLHRSVAAELRDRIRRGDLPVGASLPSEAQLCREFVSSRGPVRQALATLREEGLIGGGRGRRPVALDAVPAPALTPF